MQLQKGLPELQKAGLKNVIAISYDSVEILKKFSDRHKIQFPLLSDPESKTIVAYAVKNQEMKGKKYGKFDLDGIPHPGTMIIDATMTIRAKIFLEHYRDRHTVEDLIKEVKKLK